MIPPPQIPPTHKHTYFQQTGRSCGQHWANSNLYLSDHIFLVQCWKKWPQLFSWFFKLKLQEQYLFLSARSLQHGFPEQKLATIAIIGNN